MDSLSFPVEWKAVDDSPHGSLDGYMSVFGNVDLGGDVVMPGAFRKTFADWSRAKTRMPLIADHNLSTEGVIGSVDRMTEDTKGARIRARFSSVAKAQDIRRNMIEGHISGLSFTYAPIRYHYDTKGDQRVRALDEVKVFEATVTPFPLNVLATASAKGDPDAAAAAATLAADTVGGPIDFDLLEEILTKAFTIPDLAIKRAAINAALARYDPTDPAAAGPDEADTSGAAADTDSKTAAVDTAEDVSAESYALRIAHPGPPDAAPATPAAGVVSITDAARDTAVMDTLERAIEQALGREKADA